MISQLHRRFLAIFVTAVTFSFAHFASAVIRDGGVDPNNLGQGGWILYMKDATNHLAPSNIPAVTNENSLFKYLKGQGLDYVIVKAATSNMLWTGSFVNTNLPPMFTKELVNAAHRNGLKIFGSNRSWGNDIPGEIAVADYVFQQGADGFIYDAEAEWESNRPWIGTNGPALAWQLCSTVRSNWPNKFIAHNPFATVYLHFSFPFKEFGYWCDAVMPQVYHFSATRNNAFAAIHWNDWNYKRLHEYYATLPPSIIDGQTIHWTNAIKPLVLMRDVYNGGSGTPNHPDSDVRNFLDYMVADPNCVTEGGYNGSDYFRSELHREGQWANIKSATIGFRSNIVNNIILDDARATAVGNWTMIKTIDATVSTIQFTGEVSGDTNSFGTNYWRKVKGTGANMQFRPTVAQGGNYDVYEWHPTRPDASASVPFVINSATGLSAIFVNQQTNGGDWNLIGRYYFNAGTNSTIQILDTVLENNAVAMVDGLKMVYVPVLPMAPTNLTATAVNSSQINLQWIDISTNELNFIIARGTTPGGPYFDVGSAPANNSNFTDTGLLDGTTYYYTVRARAYNIDSTESNEASAATPPGLPTIIAQPVGKTVVEGQSATFSVEAGSSSPITYQWRFNNLEILGATNSSYTLSNITAVANAGEYSVAVANHIGSIPSAAAILTVNFSLQVSANPPGAGTIAISPNQPGYAFQSVVNLSATSNPGYIFVGWTGDGLQTTNSIDVAMTSSKVLVAHFLNADEIIIDNPDASYEGVWTIGSAATDKFGAYYQYAATDAGGDLANAIYTPNIVTPGKYSVSVWYPQGTNRTSQAPVTIAFDGDSVSTELDQTAGGGSWQTIAIGKDFAAGTGGYVEIGNTTGEDNKIVVADAVRFSFNPAPVIFSQPQSQTVGISSNATFHVLAASTTPFTYQWQFNGVNIPGATTSSYTRANAQTNDSGEYTVVLSNQVETVTSDAAALTVITFVPATFGSASITGEGFHFSLAGSANVTYAIEASTNLVDWIVLTNIFTPDGNLEFTDPLSDETARFYRTRWVQ